MRAGALLVLVCWGVQLPAGFAQTSDSQAKDLHGFLEPLRAQYGWPALAAVVIQDGKVAAIGAVGVRKHGARDAVTVTDKFHIGSCTKSMTATVAAMLVERGKISWDTTVAEIFPELKSSMHAQYRDVTLEQLFSHRGGAPANADPALWAEAWKMKGTPTQQRYEFVKGTLAKSPEAAPGTKYIYSNQGYAIAGAMLEKVTGKPWEELMRTMLFEPLDMKSAGFGPPSSEGKIDQPWGHKLENGNSKAYRADNPPAIGPAGTVHCSLSDLARYVTFHMKGEKVGSKFLKAESFRKLHTPVAGGNCALGWFAVKDGATTQLNHAGSNTMFYVLIRAWPVRNCAVIVATNIAGDAVDANVDAVAGALTEKFAR